MKQHISDGTEEQDRDDYITDSADEIVIEMQTEIARLRRDKVLLLKDKALLLETAKELMVITEQLTQLRQDKMELLAALDKIAGNCIHQPAVARAAIAKAGKGS